VELAAVKMLERIWATVQGWLVGSLAKLKAITAVLCAPSAGAACGEDAVTGPATPAPGSSSSSATLSCSALSAGRMVGSTSSVSSPVSSCQFVTDVPAPK
jgi:hypothetical protein